MGEILGIKWPRDPSVLTSIMYYHRACIYTNSGIIQELANYERNVNRNNYKYFAYRNAANTLAAHPKQIKSGEEARKLKNIGEKIAKKIDEYLDSGTLKKLEKIRNETPTTAINELTRVSGIGPSKASELFNAGISSIDDLHHHKDKLNHHQLIGLKYFKDFEKRIPRKEIQELEMMMMKELQNLDSSYVMTVCGSYRREKSESGDIDVLITHPSYISTNVNQNKQINLKTIVSLLETKKIVTDTLSLGNTKFMGVCNVNTARGSPDHGIGRRLDIRFTPYDQYYCTVLYFTGSDIFNKSMRAHALKQGYTLNEYSLRRLGITGVPGEPVPITSEEDIFDYIHFSYKFPQDRN